MVITHYDKIKMLKISCQKFVCQGKIRLKIKNCQLNLISADLEGKTDKNKTFFNR